MTPALAPPRRAPVRLRPQDEAVARHLARELGAPEPVSRALAARGFGGADAARAFLTPSREGLHDPFSMAGLGAAVDRLGASACRGGRVVVFGDYDCDGIGALAILTRVLSRLGADVRPFIPHRLRDGYGLTSATLRRALEEHRPEGIVTVDCGITAREPVEEATRAGVYMVITDHHLPPDALPRDAILVDPKLPGCAYPFKDLSGAGIAWKLAGALLARGGAEAGLSAAAGESWHASLGKIAAVSTIADVVPLTGENRVIVSWGLAGLAEPRAPGLAALLRRAGIAKGRPPTAREVAFRVAPRLNALGRLDHAFRALELLTTSDAGRAETLAAELEAANAERRALQDRLVATVLARLAVGFEPARDAVVVEAGSAADGWHRGVLGIAASKVAEKVGRPVLLFTRDGDSLSGSGRTWGRTPLFARVAPVARRYASAFGGHDAALGLTLPAAGWEAFRDELREAFSSSRDDAEWAAETLADADVAAAEVTDELTGWVERFEPTGPANPRPLFRLRGLGWDGRGRRIGENGLRTTLEKEGIRIDAVGWKLGAVPPDSRPPRVDVAAHLARDAFTARPTLEIVALEPASP